MKPLLLLDFDRTLFDTDSFWQDFAKCLSEVSGLSSQEIFNQYQGYAHAYKKSDNVLRYVGYDNFIDKYQINHQEIIDLVNKNIRGDRYIYADANELLLTLLNNSSKLDFAILSYGQERFQSLKISSCDSLKGVISYITHIPKADFIRHYLADRQGYLIDDKIGQNLATGWTEVNINRSLKLKSAHKLGGCLYQISDFYQLFRLLDRKYRLTA